MWEMNSENNRMFWPDHRTRSLRTPSKTDVLVGSQHQNISLRTPSKRTLYATIKTKIILQIVHRRLLGIMHKVKAVLRAASKSEKYFQLTNRLHIHCVLYVQYHHHVPVVIHRFNRHHTV